jgi:ABC-type dipeptide/oligopeptide/nickel transport system permease component
MTKKGESHYASKLTEEQVKEMRKRYELGKQLYADWLKNTVPAIAKDFGVARQTAWEAIDGITWKHVE